MTPALAKTIDSLKPMLDALLDPVAVLDPECRIVHASSAMRGFLSVRPHELAKTPVFCDLLTIPGCEQGCQVKQVVSSGVPFHLGEAPVSCQGKKMRIFLNAAPLRDLAGPGKQVIGVFVTLRDASPEIVLQAKYHKVTELLDERDTRIEKLLEQLDLLRGPAGAPRKS